MILLGQSSTENTTVISEQDKRNFSSLAFDLDRCDSIAKINDSVKISLKTTIFLDSVLLSIQQQEFEKLSDNTEFTKDQTNGVTARLNRSEKKRENLKTGLVSVTLLEIVTIVWGFIRGI